MGDYLKILIAVTSLSLLGATCGHQVIDDSASLFAAEAGQATMILGGCERPLRMGHESCLYERGKPLPNLVLAFLNQAEYMVSDCNFGILAVGTVKEPSVVSIDLAPIQRQLDELGVCTLEVSAKEYYPDPGDSTKLRMIPFVGGFFLRTVRPGFFPIPERGLISWCYKVMRTNKGRTVMEQCTP